jgi:hypothetical protein
MPTREEKELQRQMARKMRLAASLKENLKRRRGSQASNAVKTLAIITSDTEAQSILTANEG